MRSTWLAPWMVVIIGVILIIAESVLIIVFVMNPVEQSIAAAQTKYNANIGEGTPEIVNEAKAALLASQTQLDATKSQWHVKETALMPAYDLSHRYAAWRQIAHELSENLGPSLERWMAHSNVAQLTPISIAAPPSSPNQISTAPLVIPVSSGGAMSVGGDFRTILQHIVKWNDFNRLVIIDKVALHGNSPYMKGDYTASVIIFPQNADKAETAITTAGGGAGGAAGGPRRGL